jgi:hypothetical protein
VSVPIPKGLMADRQVLTASVQPGHGPVHVGCACFLLLELSCTGHLSSSQGLSRMHNVIMSWLAGQHVLAWPINHDHSVDHELWRAWAHAVVPLGALACAMLK